MFAVMSDLLIGTNISFAFGGRRILENVSLAVAANEFVGLIGANGSGKTTLLRILLGLLPAQTGEIILCGDKIQNLKRRQIALRATLVQQDTAIDFDFTAREIVAMGRTPHLGRFSPEKLVDRQAVARAMQETETEIFAERLVTELSGGERQRVHLARALAQQTDLILLDEPTSNLDLTNQFEALRTIKNATRATGKAALAAIHDLSLAAQFCDRLLLLANRKIVAAGTPAEVVTESNLLDYFGLRARVKPDAETGALIIIPFGAN